jgi:hypothetical protein
MAVFPIDIDVQLAGDHMIDAVILQWWTALEDGPGRFGASPAAVLEQKTREINRLAVWLQNDFDPNTPSRPLFIVVPEVSFPPNLLGRAEDIIQSLHRPCIFVAGLNHLTWDEYTALIGQYENMPANGDWLDGGAQEQFVNAAAIVIRSGAHGTPLARFLQLKVHPFNAEAPHLFRGSHTLLFRSRNRASGSRLDFAVKICSDFVNPEAVRNFRREVEAATPGTQLDLTIVLQWQDTPEDIQFKQGVMAYFEPPIGMVETSRGAVLFANSGNEFRGRSSRFGGSRLDVVYAQRFRLPSAMPCQTCVSNEYGAFNHQALVLRDGGPCVYRLTFKPIYLINPVPGSGDEHPFRPGECAFLDEEGPSLIFCALQPICHWIESEWRNDEIDLLAAIGWANEGGAAAVTYLSFVRQAHRAMREFWIAEMGAREVEVRDGIQNYTDLLKARPDSPHKQAEPWRWGDSVSRAARRFMRVLTLVSLGLPAATPLRFPSRLTVRHAMLGETIALSLIWGNGDCDPIQMLGRFQNLHQQYGVGEFFGHKWLLILVDPVVPLTPYDLETWRASDITRGTMTDANGNRTEAVGDLVRVEQGFDVISAPYLMSALTSSQEPAVLQARLRDILEPNLV